MLPPSTISLVIYHLSRAFIIGGISALVLNTNGFAVASIYSLVIGIMMIAEDYIKNHKDKNDEEP